MKKTFFILACLVVAGTAQVTEEWVARFDGPKSGGDGTYAIEIDNIGNVYVTGSSEGPGTFFDSATIKYSQGPAVEEIPVPSPIQLSSTLNRLSYELPGEAQLNVYSADGRKVVSETVEGKGIWTPSDLSTGVYFAKIATDDYSVKTKLTVVR